MGARAPWSWREHNRRVGELAKILRDAGKIGTFDEALALVDIGARLLAGLHVAPKLPHDFVDHAYKIRARGSN